MLEWVGSPIVITTVAVSAIIFTIFWRNQNGWKVAGRRYPPSLPVLPLIGAIIRGGMSVLPEHFMKSAEKLGPVISYNFGGRLVIILNGKEAISDAFVRKSEAFADRVEFWTERNILNHDLRGITFARYNDTFKKHHKLCLTILKEFGFGVHTVSENRILHEVEYLNQEILKFNGRPFNPILLTVYSSFNVVSNILFGEVFMMSDTCHTISARVHEFVKHTDFSINMAPFLRFLPYFRDQIAAMVRLHEDIINGIEEGIECSKSAECETTFIRRFVEIQGPNFDRKDLLYIIRDLCFASSDTASTVLQWAIVELANHPEVQARFQREIDDVVPRDRVPSLDDKPRLPYTEAVILEVMRRHTTVPLYVPHATLKDTEVLGCHIPVGSMVMANAFCAHMDEKSWTDPLNFRPERFLDENQSIVGSEKVIAFGMGKRSCLGESLGRHEVFLFLTSLVQRFDIRPPEGRGSLDVKEIIAGIMQTSEFEVRMIPRMMFKK